SSGQRGQTVNLLTTSSQVRILLSPQIIFNTTFVLNEIYQIACHQSKINTTILNIEIPLIKVI
ncbi:hypothetical protein, partial [Winogradskyella wichelsiae]|uniref:hypothetical protein n=1 Tax=Winogradskyella wichelsiae TaxID=2697007 RepID=UPI003EFB1F10